MIAYSYNPITGLYGGPVTCDPSPLEEGEVLLPAFATFAAPPDDVPEGYVVRWTGAVWRAVPPPPIPEPEPPTEAEVLATFSGAVQAVLDGQARAWGYDGILSAVSYADEASVARFAAEGAALRAWRSAVWAACYEILGEVTAQTRAQPTVEALLAELPSAPARPAP